MTYIYDVLLNFTDDERIIEFFEWDDKDYPEHIKRIPLLRVSTKTLDDLLNKKVKVNNDLLDKIKGETSLYKKSTNLDYATLFSDLNKVIALEFNESGEVISKSSLLLDEEEDLIEEAVDLREEPITYKILSKNSKDYFLTRQEVKKKRYLLKEMDNLYEENNIEKLNFLYEELFKKDDLSFYDKYMRIKKDLTENYSKKHNKLYDIVRLTYIKK
ncbi:MAG: DUF3603 family protein [Mycoplasmatota bacterium]|nr:DUF3603 family protein [Mycoplasmatota bacterium]